MPSVYFAVTHNVSNTVCYGLTEKSLLNSGITRPFAQVIDGTVKDHRSFANPTHNSCILLHTGYFPSHLFKRTISFPVFKGASPWGVRWCRFCVTGAAQHCFFLLNTSDCESRRAMFRGKRGIRTNIFIWGTNDYNLPILACKMQMGVSKTLKGSKSLGICSA